MSALFIPALRKDLIRSSSLTVIREGRPRFRNIVAIGVTIQHSHGKFCRCFSLFFALHCKKWQNLCKIRRRLAPQGQSFGR